MTFIKPHSRKHFRLYVICAIFGILFVSGIYISEYNSVVNFRYQVQDLKVQLVELQAQNADLKNAVYSENDPRKLQEFAQGKGYTLERKPEYLRMNPWVSDSSL